MVYELRNQPIRGLYLTYQYFTTAFIRLPLWIMLSLPTSWRPRKSWSLKRCIMIRLVRHMSTVVTKAGPFSVIPNHLALASGPGIKGAWIDAAPPSTITPDLASWASIANVTPIPLPGYWLDKAPSDASPSTATDIPLNGPPTPGEKVLYCLHGGGYTQLSAHPSDPSARIARGLLTTITSIRRAFSIEYRLSKAAPEEEEGGAFPAALLDALAGYVYLVKTLGFKEEDVILEGDSAGGNLALALTRYLVENHSPSPFADKDVPAPPGALILLSPWTDVSASHDVPGASAYTNMHSDYLTGPIQSDGRMEYNKRAFLGAFGLGAAEFNVYISPASKALDGWSEGEDVKGKKGSGRFKGFPRTFINAGGAEVLRDQVRTLRDRMSADLGDGVTYLEAPDAVHDYLVFEWHEPERRDTLEAIGKWVALGQ